MIPAAFEYERADSVEHAVDLLSADADAKVIAGGHSLLPLMKVRFAQPSKLVDIGRIRDLSYIREDGDVIAVGALTRHHDVANSELLQSSCPIVADVASQIGDPQVRHMGTLGGAVAHCRPCLRHADGHGGAGRGDGGGGPGGETRNVGAADFFKGLFTPDLEANELLTEVSVPRTSGGWSYLKFHRRAIDWAWWASRRCSRTGRPRWCSPTWARPRSAPPGWKKRSPGGADPATASQRADEGTAPPSDAFGSAEYRRELSKVLVRRALEEAMG